MKSTIDSTTHVKLETNIEKLIQNSWGSLITKRKKSQYEPKKPVKSRKTR